MTIKEFWAAKANDEKARQLISEHIDVFEKMERTINKYNSQCVPRFSLKETLEVFVADNSIECSGAQCLQKINDAGHGEILSKFYELFFQRKD